MKQIAMLLIVCLALFLISGCAHKTIVVPTKCVIQEVDSPLLDYETKRDSLGESKRCVYNYTKYKEAFEKQQKAIQACR